MPIFRPEAVDEFCKQEWERRLGFKLTQEQYEELIRVAGQHEDDTPAFTPDTVFTADFSNWQTAEPPKPRHVWVGTKDETP